ncbi:MAG: DNA gyrase subunit A, partial [Nitrosopumilaceae archaeon]
NILSHAFEDIVASQIQYLRGKKVEDIAPFFTPFRARALKGEPDKNSSTKWLFHGQYSIKDTSTLCITELPYGITHEKFISHLSTLLEREEIVDFVDESRDKYNIIVKFKRGTLSDKNINQIKKQLKLISHLSENITVIDFDGKCVLVTDYVTIIKQFTEWRLGWYKVRYSRLANLLKIDITKYMDILLAIKYNIGNVARKTYSRAELKEYLEEIKVTNLDYIADLPVYRFTEEEKEKTEKKLTEATKELQIYENLIESDSKRKDVYINELKCLKSTT